MKRGLFILIGFFILIFSLNSFVSAGCSGTMNCGYITTDPMDFSYTDGISICNDNYGDYCYWNSEDNSCYNRGTGVTCADLSKDICTTEVGCTWDEFVSDTSGNNLKGAGLSCLVNSDCTSNICEVATTGVCSGSYIDTSTKVNWNNYMPFTWIIGEEYGGQSCNRCKDAENGHISYFVENSNWYKHTCVKNKFIFCGGGRWSESRTFVRPAYATVKCDTLLSQGACTPTGCSWTSGISGVCKVAAVTACVPAPNPTLSGVCGDKNCGTASNGSCVAVTCGTCTVTGQTCNLVMGKCLASACVPATNPTLSGICGTSNCGTAKNGSCADVACPDCTIAGQTCQSGICKDTSVTKCTSGQLCTNGACSCNDGKDCTTDTCSSSGSCVYTNKVIASPCTDDGKSYTIDVCFNGECLHTPSACATDNNECTKDYYSADGICTHTNEETGKPCKVSNNECKNYICSSGTCVVHSTKSNCAVLPCAPKSPPTFAGVCGDKNCGTASNGSCAAVTCGACTIAGQTCNFATGKCVATTSTVVCGDGKKEGTEACDDGNLINSDGCSSICIIETGWTCTAIIIPNVCIRITTLKENGASCSLNSECTSGNCTNSICSAQVFNFIWKTNSTINASLPDIGNSSSPTIFYKDSYWYMISGEAYGNFFGFIWDGIKWLPNSTINASLPNLQYHIKPYVFYKDSSWYLISGNYYLDANGWPNGKFYGFVWDNVGSHWHSNSTINASLPNDIPSASPSVFQKDGKWYLISGSYYGTFFGFVWNGTNWVADLAITNSLPDIGFMSTPSIFYKDSNWYLISGSSSGLFFGFIWNGTQWKTDLIINASLLSIGESSAPSVFSMSLNNWYLISGSSGGGFYGYKYYAEGTNIPLKENGASCSSNSECMSGNCTNLICSAICTPVTNPCGGKNCGTVTNGTCGNVTCGTCTVVGQACNSTGQCVVSSCSTGYADCDSNTANGCEIQLGTATHCASCTNVCTSGQSCVNNICKIQEDTLTLKRIAFWEGKVNQHTENGVWTADPNEISDVNVDKLTYCKKFYLNTLSVRAYQVETIPSWKSVGSTGAPISAPKQSYECVQSGGATTISCELGCSLSNGRCVQIGYRQGVKYCSPNGDFVNQIADDAICDNNFECTSNFCVERKCISGTLIQKILSWFRDLFSPR